MADITKKIIDIDPGKSLVTMKQLRDETNAYREALLNLDEGSEEYVKIAKQVADNQAKINAAMQAGKKYTDDEAGSYNALVAEMAKLKDAWKATGDAMERAKLGEKIKEINDQLKDMDASIGNHQRDVGNYAKGWTGLAKGLGDVSKIGKDASEGLEGLGKVLGLAGTSANAFNDSVSQLKASFKIGEAIAKTTQGLKDYVAASIAAAKAAKAKSTAQTKAAAAETAEASAASAAAAANTAKAKATIVATTATKAATKAQKLFNIALKASGIGIVLALLGALAANWDKVKAAISPAIEKFEEFGKKAKEVMVNVVANIFGGCNAIAEIFKGLWKSITELGQSIVTFYTGLFDTVKKGIETIGNAWETLWKKKEEGGGVQAAIQALKTGFKEAGDIAVGTTDAIWEEFKNNFDLKGAFEKGKTGAKEMLNDIGEGLKKLRKDNKKDKSNSNGEDIVGDKLKDVLAEILKTDYEQQLENLEKERILVLERAKQNGEDLVKIEKYYADKRAEIQKNLQEQQEGITGEQLTAALAEVRKKDYTQQIKDLEKERDAVLALAKEKGENVLALEKYYAEQKAELVKKAEEEALGETGLKLREKLQNALNEMHKTDYAAQLEELKKEEADVLAIFQGTEEEKVKLKAYYAEKQLEIQKKLNDELNKEDKNRKKNQIAMFDAIGESMGNLSGLFEEDTIAYKALATSQALISTFLAGTRVMAEQEGNMWVKIAAMAAVITAGLASVAKIVAVNPKGETGGASASAPTTAAAIPVIGGGSSINYTRSLTTAEEEDRMNQPQYVSVVDINRVQNQVKVVEQNSSF